MTEYDPTEEGVKVNIVDGAGSLGDKIDALSTAVDTLETTISGTGGLIEAINALIAALAP